MYHMSLGAAAIVLLFWVATSLGASQVSSETNLVCRGQGETKEKEAEHSRVVGGKFNKQGSLTYEVCLGQLKASRSSSHSPNLKSLNRGFNWVQSHTQSRWSQYHRTISRLCPWVPSTTKKAS